MLQRFDRKSLYHRRSECPDMFGLRRTSARSRRSLSPRKYWFPDRLNTPCKWALCCMSPHCSRRANRRRLPWTHYK